MRICCVVLCPEGEGSSEGRRGLVGLQPLTRLLARLTGSRSLRKSFIPLLSEQLGQILEFGSGAYGILSSRI